MIDAAEDELERSTLISSVSQALNHKDLAKDIRRMYVFDPYFSRVARDVSSKDFDSLRSCL